LCDTRVEEKNNGKNRARWEKPGEKLWRCTRTRQEFGQSRAQRSTRSRQILQVAGWMSRGAGKLTCKSRF